MGTRIIEQRATVRGEARHREKIGTSLRSGDETLAILTLLMMLLPERAAADRDRQIGR